MKKIKAILIVLILAGLACYYHDNIISFTSQLPFVQSSQETDPETDKSGYEYYFKPYYTEK